MILLIQETIYGTLLKSAPGQTEMKVVKVETQGTAGATVTTQGGEQFTGRSVLCTFSVGMLDPDTGEGDAIFGNLLTADKRAAWSSRSASGPVRPVT